MKSFKRKFAAFMAVVLALTSFNIAWAAKTKSSNAPLQFSEDNGTTHKNIFELKVGSSAKTITVSVATPSVANLKVTDLNVSVASGSNADEIATVATTSNAEALNIEPVGEGIIKVEVTATGDTTASGSNGTVNCVGTFTIKVNPKDASLVFDKPSVTITAGDPKVNIIMTVKPDNASLTAMRLDLSELTEDGLEITHTAPANNKSTISVKTTADAKGISGNIKVYATVNGKEVTGKIPVTVNPKVVSGSLEFLPGEFTLEPGKGQNVIVSVASPSNATLTDLAVDLTATSGLKVTVDQANNMFYLEATEDATSNIWTVPVSAKVNGELKSGSIKVTIKAYEPDNDKVTSVEVTFNGDPNQEYYVGQHIIATAQIKPDGIHPDVLFEPTGVDCTMSQAEGILHGVDIIPHTSGMLNVKVTAGKLSNSASVKVNPITSSMKFKNKSVAIPNKGAHDFNEDLEITVTKPATGTLHDDILSDIKSSVRFESSDKNILTVDENGLGTAVKPGIVTVKATTPANNMTAECKVQVLNDNTYQIVLDKAEMKIEDVNLIQELKADIYLVEDGKEPVLVTDLDKEGLLVKWTSSDVNVATVDEKGMVTSIKEGTADVIATVTDKTGKDFDPSVSQKCKVTVTKVTPIQDEAVIGKYKNDPDVLAVLADPKNVTKEQAIAAANKVASSILTVNPVALLKNKAEATKVMDDISSIEEALLATGAVSKFDPVISSNKIRGIDADGLAMNALAAGGTGAGLEVSDNATMAVPQAIVGKTILSSITFDISIKGVDGQNLTVPLRLKIALSGGGYTSNNTGVLHMGKRGLEIVPCMVDENGNAIVTVTDLSPFAIVKLQTTPGGNTVPSYGGGGSSSGSTTRLAPAIPETPGFWFATATGWQFYSPDGIMYVNTWIYKGGQWYWVDAAGTMSIGWTQISGKKYYLNPATGAMQVGWIAIAEQNTWYYTDANGAMVTGWQQINGKWYYFDANGAMLANANTPDGYYVNADGVWVQ